MFTKFSSIIENFTQWLIGKQLTEAFNKGHRAAVTQREEENKKIKQFQIDEAINKKVIYVSNEWEDPTFAIITGEPLDWPGNKTNSTPLLPAKCALTGKPLMLFLNCYYLADEKMVDAILKLDPFERWNLSAGKAYTYNMWEKSYPPRHELTDPVVLKAKLKEVNFI